MTAAQLVDALATVPTWVAVSRPALAIPEQLVSVAQRDEPISVERPGVKDRRRSSCHGYRIVLVARYCDVAQDEEGDPWVFSSMGDLIRCQQDLGWITSCPLNLNVPRLPVYLDDVVVT